MHTRDEFTQLQLAAIDTHLALVIAQYQLTDEQSDIAHFLWSEGYMAQRSIRINEDLLITYSNTAHCYFTSIGMLRHDAAQCVCQFLLVNGVTLQAKTH